MFTRTYRPQIFDHVYGQEENIEVLKAIIHDPSIAPRSVIMQGDYGCGKTTCARILAKGLNCNSTSIQGRPCGECVICKDDLSFTPFYQEFDSSDVGNVETIRGMKGDLFMRSQVCKWRVVVFDEAHLISKTAQGALLKTLEEMPENMFVVFCTTDVQNVVNTIRSRSIELSFRTLSIDEIKSNLKRIVIAENTQVPEEVLNTIAMSSQGHVRDSVMMLDMYSMMEDKTKFIGGMRSSELEIVEFLIGVKKGGDIQKYVTAICRKPLDRVRVDLYFVLRNLIFQFGGAKAESFYDEKYKELAELYGADCVKLFAFSLSDWAVNCFKQDITVQAFLWSVKVRFSQSQEREGLPSLLDRARKH